MTRNEALVFLELPFDATDQQARQRLADKFFYYKEQIENAGSAFLKNLNARHLDTVKTIQREFTVWNTQQPEVCITFTDDELEEPEIAENELEYLTTPVIVSHSNKSETGNASTTITEIPGWLVSFASDKPAQTYGLMPGNNYIGRKADPAYSPSIVIDNDPYVSKVHAVVVVERNNEALFYLMDAPIASKNGIFLNGSTDRIAGKVILKDGDTIQVGATKFILRINKTSTKDIQGKTQKNRFVHTVILGNS